MKIAPNKAPLAGKPLFLAPASQPLLLPTGAGRETRRRLSAGPTWMKSTVIARATRDAGSTMYELLGMAELMRVAYEKGEMESAQNRLALLLSGAAGLSSDLGNIIELTKLEAAPIETNYLYFDIVAVLQEVSHTARRILGQKPVKVMDVSTPSPVMVLSDPAKVRRIMTGIISNAAKFTDRGRITLILNKDEDRIRVTVTDTGVGMNAERIQEVFMSSDHGYDIEINGQATSGLGLRIVKNLVKLLDGAMSVDSRVNEGTIVTISLPLGPREKPSGSGGWMRQKERLVCGRPF